MNAYTSYKYLLIGASIALGVIAGGLLSGYIPTLKSSITPSPQLFNFSANTISKGYAEIVSNALPTVVSVYRINSEQIDDNSILNEAHYQQFAKQKLTTERNRSKTLGSGVIVSASGYIITNYHVIANADKIEVELYDGRSTQAILIGNDPETDLAVLKIDLPHLQAIKVPKLDLARPGDLAFAIGNPYGLGTSVTMGVISALGRTELGIHTFESFIQTDAPINQGNSGGALINSDGYLIGINSARFRHIKDNFSTQGVGLAIPTATVVDIATKIIHQGRVLRSWLGVELRLFSKQGTHREDKNTTILINSVLSNGPAFNAGLEAGDMITSVDGIQHDSPHAMIDYIAQLPPGSQIKIAYLRYGNKHSTHALLETRPESK